MKLVISIALSYEKDCTFCIELSTLYVPGKDCLVRTVKRLKLRQKLPHSNTVTMVYKESTPAKQRHTSNS